MKLTSLFKLITSFLLFAALLVPFGLIAQDTIPSDTVTAVITDSVSSKFPWLTLIITAAIAAVPTLKLLHLKGKFAKAITLLQVVQSSLADSKITNAEGDAIQDAIKDLLAKEGEDISPSPLRKK